MTSQTNLRDILCGFLENEKEVIYPVLETRLLQLNPTRITDDFQYFLDVPNIEGEINARLNNYHQGSSYKLYLKRWRFEFNKIPNSHHFTFGLIVEDFDIVRTNTILQFNEEPKPMIEDQSVYHLFEQKKRAEISKALERGSRRNTPGKSSLMKLSHSTASGFGGGNITPSYKGVGRIVSPGKFSVPKRIGKMSPFISRPFFANAGIRRPSEYSAVDREYLSLYELLDVPEWIPNLVGAEVVRVKPDFMKKLISKHTTDYQPMEKVNEFSSSLGSLSPSRSVSPDVSLKSHREIMIDLPEVDRMNFKNIQKGLASGLLNWDQLVFKKECLEYMEKNISLN